MDASGWSANDPLSVGADRGRERGVNRSASVHCSVS